MQIDVLCKTDKILEITQPSLISSRTGCIITCDRNIMKIGGSHKNISYKTKFKNNISSFEETDISILEKILETAPKVTHNFNQYKLTLRAKREIISNRRDIAIERSSAGTASRMTVFFLNIRLN